MIAILTVYNLAYFILQGEKLDKLEKADILELTVKYIKQLQRTSVIGTYAVEALIEIQHLHTGKCICRFAGIYAYCRYFIDRKW